MSLLYILDLIGTFAFALSGALVAARKQMDIYGMFILALVTAVGGGTIRDMMLGRLPPFVFKDGWYLAVTLAAALIVFISPKYIEYNLKLLNFVDAVGLGVFTCIGNMIAVEHNIKWYGVILFGVMTATVGGMIRDVLAREVPFVLQKEVYASASIVGGLIFIMLRMLDVNYDVNIVITATVVTSIRLLSIYKNWNLPRLFKRGNQCEK